MTHIFFKTLIIIGLSSSIEAHAQTRDQTPNCNIEREIIVQLKYPDIGSYAVWDTIWGEQNEQERFERGIALENSETLVVGHKAGGHFTPDQLILAHIRKNGRVRWHKAHDLRGLSSIVKLLKHKEGFLVAANRNNPEKAQPKKLHNTVWIGFFDNTGALKSHKELSERGTSLYAHDLTLMHPTKKTRKPRYLLATSKSGSQSAQKSVSALYILDDNAKILSKRALITGLENRILGLTRLENKKDHKEDGGFLGVGYSHDQHDRKTGWLVRLDHEGGLLWERQYPRGAGAQLVTGLPFLKDAFILTGTAAPAIQGGKRAAWVMAVSRKNGTILWQRYFSGILEFRGRDMLISKDGIISVLIDGEVPEEEKEKPETPESPKAIDHVRLLTLDPRGTLLKNEAYFNQEGVDTYDLIEGPNEERIMIGQTNVVYQIEGANHKTQQDDIKLKRSKNAWINAAVPVDSYNDPCAPKPYKVP